MTPLATQMMNATVELEQPLGAGQRRVGTGFLVAATCDGQRPCTVLVTAGHVFRDMAKATVTVGYRVERADGDWVFSPQPVRIRDSQGHPLWTRHPARDVAAIEVAAPEPFARAAIPASYLAPAAPVTGPALRPGDELLTLGFPEGLASNEAGFPILRAGRVSSYPLAPAERVPTFLLDFAVFGGDSGGPVFAPQADVAGVHRGAIAGLLTQQVEDSRGRLEIGVVTQAQFICETLALLRTGALPPSAMAKPTGARGAQTARRAVDKGG